MMKIDMPVVLFDPDLNGSSGFFKVSCPTFTEDAVYVQ
jgi:hypothetical protein